RQPTSGDWDSVIRDVAGALRSLPPAAEPMSREATPPDADYRRAVTLYQSGQISEAEQTCRAITHLHPRQADALHLLGVIALDTGRTDQAIALFDEVLALKPDNATAYNNRGNALARQGRFDDAV